MEQTSDMIQRAFKILLSLYFGGILTALLILLYMSSL